MSGFFDDALNTGEIGFVTPLSPKCCACGQPGLQTGFGTLCWDCFSKAQDDHIEHERRKHRGKAEVGNSEHAPGTQAGQTTGKGETE